jgi:hypothetical protein
MKDHQELYDQDGILQKEEEEEKDRSEILLLVHSMELKKCYSVMKPKNKIKKSNNDEIILERTTSLKLI